MSRTSEPSVRTGNTPPPLPPSPTVPPLAISSFPVVPDLPFILFLQLWQPVIIVQQIAAARTHRNNIRAFILSIILSVVLKNVATQNPRVVLLFGPSGLDTVAEIQAQGCSTARDRKSTRL